MSSEDTIILNCRGYAWVKYPYHTRVSREANKYYSQPFDIAVDPSGERRVTFSTRRNCGSRRFRGKSFRDKFYFAISTVEHDRTKVRVLHSGFGYSTRGIHIRSLDPRLISAIARPWCFDTNMFGLKTITDGEHTFKVKQFGLWDVHRTLLMSYTENTITMKIDISNELLDPATYIAVLLFLAHYSFARNTQFGR